MEGGDVEIPAAAAATNEAEQEDVVAALREMQAEVEKEMGSGQDSAAAAASQTNREEVDSRSIFVGNLGPTTAVFANPTGPPSEGTMPFHRLLKSIDMATLSQSELLAFSSLSSTKNSAVQPTPTESAAIDHSTFNESSGSRRQSYSRPSPHHHHRHHRLTAALPNSNPNPNPSPSLPSELDPDHLDCHSILASLKRLLSSHPDFQSPDPVDLIGFSQFYSYDPAAGLSVGERSNRKRGRKPRAIGVGVLVNRDGVAVDLAALASKEDPYAGALAQRTSGMDGEEKLLEFFAGLSGEWCSRRKRRKVVDASEFGDALPRGWKLLLALRRKEGQAWVYCRRYVSPDGQHFISCKEVAEYLQSFTRSYGVQPGKDYPCDGFWQVTYENHANAMETEGAQKLSMQHDNEITMLDLDNLVEVQVHDLFQCFKCNISFDEKESYLQHLLLVHQQSTGKPRGGPVGEGVIIKDGKYECQFCHKIFNERRRYSSHVGIHVRNYVRGVEDAPGVRIALERSDEPQITDESPARISKMDALVEIAQNSIHDRSSSGPNHDLLGGSNSDKPNMNSTQELPRPQCDNEINSFAPPLKPAIENGESDSSAHTETDQENDDHMDIGGETQKLDGTCDVVDVMVENDHAFGTTESVKSAKQLEPDEERAVSLMSTHEISMIENSARSSGTKVGFDICSGVCDDQTEFNYPHQLCEKKGLESLSLEIPTTSLQPLHGILYNADMDKGGNSLGTSYHEPLKMSGFEELGVKEIDQLKFSSETGHASMSLQDVIPALGSGCEVSGSYDTSINFAADDDMEPSNSQQHSTLCVWCGVEFVYENVDTELQSDSVGYMCLTCKAKVCGQIGALDDGCS